MYFMTNTARILYIFKVKKKGGGRGGKRPEWYITLNANSTVSATLLAFDIMRTPSRYSRKSMIPVQSCKKNMVVA